MKPIQFEELLDLAEYAMKRDKIRAKMMALKTRRRLHLGEFMTLHFENRSTVYYQIQEMLRAEHITERMAIEHEIATYNELLPLPGHISATLMVEYPTADLRATELPKLLGLENHLWFVVDSLAPCQARFDTRQFNTERISSVQFLQFPLQEIHRNALMQENPSPQILLRIDHPSYQAEAFAPQGLVAELRLDLTV